MAGVDFLKALHPALNVLGRGSQNHSLDAVLGHEVQAALGAADHRLPHLDRQIEGARHQGDVLQLIAAVRHFGRQGVVLAAVGERLLVERLHDDLELLLEQLAVGICVKHWCAEAFHLAGVVAAPHPEDDPTARQDVCHGEVLGQPDGVPHRQNVEAAAELQALGELRQPHAQHQQVRDRFVSLALEVVLGHPQGVVAQVFHA